jgi:hypothetical protein
MQIGKIEQLTEYNPIMLASVTHQIKKDFKKQESKILIEEASIAFCNKQNNL